MNLNMIIKHWTVELHAISFKGYNIIMQDNYSGQYICDIPSSLCTVSLKPKCLGSTKTYGLYDCFIFPSSLSI